MKKVLLALVTIAVLLILTVPNFAAINDTGYSDVDAEAWYAEAVMFCDEQELMNGTGEGTFSPDTGMNRAMLATVLHRAAGSPAVSSEHPFSDVRNGTWYTDGVTWAAAGGLVTGYGNGVFGTNDTATREQIITILWRQAGSPAAVATSESTGASSWAVSAVAWAKESGITQGIPESLFVPTEGATRAEVAVMLMNADPLINRQPAQGSNVLIAYFSHTGTTKGVAEAIHTVTGGDLIEIETRNAYSETYNTVLAEAQAELSGNLRPELSTVIENIDNYDVIFVGYPIWHGTCPRAILTFLETYDLTGKTVIPFCTSGSSGISRSQTEIRGACEDSTVLSGLGLSGSSASNPQSAVTTWLDGLDLPALSNSSSTSGSVSNPDSNTLYLQIGDRKLTAALVDNSSTQALKELLASGPVTIDMQDYGNFEKVGSLDTSLPTNDQQITTEPGDLILYQGNSFAIYYAPNTWTFTRLGKINDISAAELREALSSGNVTVTLSLD